MKRALALTPLLIAAAAASPYRFDSREVLDLSLAQRLVSYESGDPIVPTALTPETTAKILALPDVDTDSPAQLDWSGKEQPPQRHNTVRIMTASGKQVVFEDMIQPSRPDADGDHEHYLMLDRIGAAKYSRVEVQFGHDAPGSFLVNPQTGATAFVHNGSDVTALSPKGRWLVTLHSSSSPFHLALAALDERGPRLALQCQGSEPSAIKSAAFKGWRDDNTLDLTIDDLALRLAFDGRDWSVAASDVARVKAVRYGCWR